MYQERLKDSTISSHKCSAALWKQYHAGKIPVIPDIKPKSPGAGDLLRGRNPAEIAKVLEAAGAPVISVVTEPNYFGGSPELLRQVVRATSIPILRKDFINNRDQLQESVDLGASAVLLIAAMLTKGQLFKLVDEALRMGLEPLVETHNEAEIMAVNKLRLTFLGINNRNIVELEIDDGSINTTERLAGLVGPEVLVLSESAIASTDDVLRAIAAGAHAVLVGTAILQAKDPVKMHHNLSERG